MSVFSFIRGDPYLCLSVFICGPCLSLACVYLWHVCICGRVFVCGLRLSLAYADGLDLWLLPGAFLHAVTHATAVVNGRHIDFEELERPVGK
jgi:hypothetical protein